MSARRADEERCERGWPHVWIAVRRDPFRVRMRCERCGAELDAESVRPRAPALCGEEPDAEETEPCR